MKAGRSGGFGVLDKLVVVSRFGSWGDFTGRPDRPGRIVVSSFLETD